MYVEFVERCTLEHVGGVPAEVLYDNMKNVVIGRENGKPNFNIEFYHFARHYGFTSRLCPPTGLW